MMHCWWWIAGGGSLVVGMLLLVWVACERSVDGTGAGALLGGCWWRGCWSWVASRKSLGGSMMR